MAKFPTPRVPLVEARMVGGNQTPTAIVVDISSTTSDKGAAFGIAKRLHRSDSPPVSHHYIVDEAVAYRCLPDHKAAYSAPYRSVKVLVCAEPREDLGLWSDASSEAVLSNAADLVAEIALAHKIRPRYLDQEAVVDWRKRRWSKRRGGIIIDVLGSWPHDSFLRDIQDRMVQKKAERN